MSIPPAPSAAPTVAIVGGGLAGLAAAAAAAQGGLRVELFESGRRLGGRAGSFRDPESGQWVDHCQHVGLGCCTNLADFWRRTGIADCFARHRTLHFVGPDGVRCEFAAAGWLPAPLHLLPALARLRYLSGRERVRIVRTLGRLARAPSGLSHIDLTIGRWLRRCGESERSIARFWSVVLESALSETVDHASLAAARKVFVDGFLASRRAYQMELPRVPLGEIYDRRLAAWMAEHGVTVRLGTRVKRIEGDARQVRGLVLPDGSARCFDFYVVAVPWRTVRALFSQELLRGLPALEGVGQIQPAAITAVHLWFDRPITDLPHAVLVERLGQWLFNRDLQHAETRNRSGAGVHCEVVISASQGLAGRDRAEILSQVWYEMAEIWPGARDAQLLRWRMLTQPAAVFSVRPDLESLRPAQQTPVANLMLAGDWTSTGWPATMESAVRSGYLAAEAVFEALGEKRQFLVPDLRRGLLARWLLQESPLPGSNCT